jgi:two-component system, OmpR family, alkaline phosphatase synthesis response regulator PhoP
MSSRVLIVEDDASLTRLLRDNLVYEGFAVECATDGHQALDKVRLAKPDLVLLDIMMPGLDGFEVCRVLSSQRERLPIIMLTARTGQDDKVKGLELGADDYVTKPFALSELLARIHAVLRRSQRLLKTLVLGDVSIDFARMRASKGRKPLVLTPREFAVLQHLAEHPGHVVSRDELLRTVWRYDAVPLTRTVDNFVARLRRKLEADPHRPRFIRTVHGDGYSLTPDG